MHLKMLIKGSLIYTGCSRVAKRALINNIKTLFTWDLDLVDVLNWHLFILSAPCFFYPKTKEYLYSTKLSTWVNLTSSTIRFPPPPPNLSVAKLFGACWKLVHTFHCESCNLLLTSALFLSSNALLFLKTCN